MREKLLNLVPTYESLATTSKVHLIQSIVSRLFVESIFEHYFIGLSSDKANELRNVEKYLDGFGEHYTCVDGRD